MSQTVTSRSAPRQARKTSLRIRLLVHLVGLVIILALLAALVFLVSGDAGSGANLTLLAVFLFIAGAGFLYSALNLVQRNLLEPPRHHRALTMEKSQGSRTVPVSAIPGDVLADLSAPGLPGEQKSRQGGSRTPAAGNVNILESGSLQILYEVVSSINTAHGLDDLLSRFLFTLKRVTHARAGAIWISHDRTIMELAALSGLSQSLIPPNRRDIQRCFYERAITEGKIWVEKSIGKCEQIAGQKFFDADEDIGLVSVPLRYRGQILGVINLFLDAGMIDSLEPLKPMLTSIGHHLSIAIEKTRSDEEAGQHIINDERTRIAHELHDSLAQSLASIRYQVRVLDETMHQGDESTTWQALERIENSLDEANTELRELIANFRAPVSRRGLLDAIEQIVSQFRNETRIKTYLQKEWSSDHLPKDVQIQILRIIQEALWNIRKHSQAKTVRIMLRQDNSGKYHILIEDDGVGISRQAYGSPGEHIGLTIMRERASRIGGNLRVESEPGEGTRVVLVFDKPETDQTP